MRGRGAGVIQIIPSIASIVKGKAMLISYSTANQSLTNTEATIAFSTDTPGSTGTVHRNGNTFVIDAAGAYAFFLQSIIYQLKAACITTIYIKRNGVVVSNIGAVTSALAQNDEAQLLTLFAGNLMVGDVITFHAINSVTVGSDFRVIAATGPAPSIPGVLLTVVAVAA
jgi:hypothetical protein